MTSPEDLDLEAAVLNGMLIAHSGNPAMAIAINDALQDTVTRMEAHTALWIHVLTQYRLRDLALLHEVAEAAWKARPWPRRFRERKEKEIWIQCQIDVQVCRAKRKLNQTRYAAPADETLYAEDWVRG